jgi:hypothetical protein
VRRRQQARHAGAVVANACAVYLPVALAERQVCFNRKHGIGVRREHDAFGGRVCADDRAVHVVQVVDLDLLQAKRAELLCDIGRARCFLEGGGGNLLDVLRLCDRPCGQFVQALPW